MAVKVVIPYSSGQVSNKVNEKWYYGSIEGRNPLFIRASFELKNLENVSIT